jgi:hypothetical protein
MRTGGEGRTTPFMPALAFGMVQVPKSRHNSRPRLGKGASARIDDGRIVEKDCRPGANRIRDVDRDSGLPELA